MNQTLLDIVLGCSELLGVGIVLVAPASVRITNKIAPLGFIAHSDKSHF